MTKYIEYKNRDDWLAGRRKSIGASEIGAVLGLSSFASPLDIWMEKTGRKPPKDLSGNPHVQFGSKAEDAIRTLYCLEHPEYTLSYHPVRVYYQEETPFLTATLDGELWQDNGTLVIYEGKTAECLSKAVWERWRNHIPDTYYCQLCQQLYCRGKEAVGSVLYAKLKGREESVLRAYEFSRADMEEDIAYIVEAAKEFWRYVETDTQPPLKIRI